jgi:hypothetical protein
MKRIIFVFIVFFVKLSLLFADDKDKYVIIGTLPDSIDNVYIYLTSIGSSMAMMTADLPVQKAPV